MLIWIRLTPALAELGWAKIVSDAGFLALPVLLTQSLFGGCLLGEVSKNMLLSSHVSRFFLIWHFRVSCWPHTRFSSFGSSPAFYEVCMSPRTCQSVEHVTLPKKVCAGQFNSHPKPQNMARAQGEHFP